MAERFLRTEIGTETRGCPRRYSRKMFFCPRNDFISRILVPVNTRVFKVSGMNTASVPTYAWQILRVHHLLRLLAITNHNFSNG